VEGGLDALYLVISGGASAAHCWKDSFVSFMVCVSIFPLNQVFFIKCTPMFTTSLQESGPVNATSHFPSTRNESPYGISSIIDIVSINSRFFVR